ncbi:MAG: enoyl-CoA hydratase/isomerase family protein [Deltaproteobacteria bacterium]|nr:enoyl-CoA hydratase/isomerase family protein [Deltaproteobacteria bacterium]MBW2362672.1 enoyl-CoA hydratase/isomerase family protein [Deltaproteobacteria bacterium]
MSYENVICERQGAIARITLNKPEKLNAFDFPGQGGMFDDFQAALGEVEEDDDVKVVIIKGSGRAFSSGHDLNTIYNVYGGGQGKKGERRPSQRARLNIDRKWIEGHQRIMLFPKITIAQIHGHCLGEGVAIMEMCDVAIAAEDAQVGHVEQRIGFAGSGINLIPFYLHVGVRRARELLLTGRAISGKEAAEIGWVTRAVPFDQLEVEVERAAKEMTLLPKDGIAIGKAAHHQIADILGMTQGWHQGYVSHTMFTNLRFEEGEYNLLKHRKEQGTRTAFHGRDDRYLEHQSGSEENE